LTEKTYSFIIFVRRQTAIPEEGGEEEKEHKFKACQAFFLIALLPPRRAARG